MRRWREGRDTGKDYDSTRAHRNGWHTGMDDTQRSSQGDTSHTGSSLLVVGDYRPWHAAQQIPCKAQLQCRPPIVPLFFPSPSPLLPLCSVSSAHLLLLVKRHHITAVQGNKEDKGCKRRHRIARLSIKQVHAGWRETHGHERSM